MGAPSRLVVGRYAIYDEIASGGMATVHWGRLLGPAGFSRTVAIKRLHPRHAKDPEFVAMLLDEARMAARVRHPNVLPALDVVAKDDELFLVMEYVLGESLAQLVRAAAAAREEIPLDVVSAIMCGVLHGLHAAHEATDAEGAPLGLVHRDVSPQNILVGADGVARVLDFGIAKAAGRIHTTRDGELKGKLAYMAPEQLRLDEVDRRTDVFAAGVVLWEALTRERLFGGSSEGNVVTNVLERPIAPPASVAPGVPAAVDRVTLRALERDPARRFPSAREMALALEESAPLASPARVAAWIERVVGEVLRERTRVVSRIESESLDGAARPAPRAAGDAVTRTEHASAVSVSSAPPPAASPRAARRRAALLAVGGALAAALAIAGLTRALSRANDVTRASAAERPLAPAPAASPAPDAPPKALDPAPPAESATPVDPAPAAPSRAPAAVRPSRAAPSAPRCTIHSYVDGAGITRFNRVCK